MERDQFDSEVKQQHLEPMYSVTFTEGADTLIEQLYDVDDAPTRFPIPEGTSLWCYFMGGGLELISEDENGPLGYFIGDELRGLVVPADIVGSVDAACIEMLKSLPGDAIVIPVWIGDQS